MIFTDQLNRKIELPAFPQRIISLVPSQTELLYDLGLGDRVVGITKFCIHPEEWFRNKTRVGGTKKLNFEKIKSLQPDLIIGNKEENQQEQIEELMKIYPVWMSDIYTLKDALNMIVSIGALTGTNEKATHIKLEIEAGFRKFEREKHLSNTRGTYFIWRNPYMVAGHSTFINDMLVRCGIDNVFADTKYSRYPELTKEEVAEAKPGIILLSSEPYPFKEKHIEELQNTCPGAKIRMVDGELFSWYGSRLVKAPSYFAELIQSLL